MKSVNKCRHWTDYAESAKSFILVILAIYLFYQLIHFLWPILVPFIIGVFITYILKPVYNFFLKIRVPVSISLLLTYLFFLALIALLVFIFIPVITSQVRDLIEYAPKLQASLIKFIDNVKLWWKALNVPEWVESEAMKAISILMSKFDSLITSLSLAGISVASGLINLLFGIYISIYFLKDWSKISYSLRQLLRNAFSENAVAMLSEANQKFESFVKGQIIVVIIVGLATGIVLSLLKVPFAPLLGILTTVFDLVPYLGPIIASILAFFLALTISPSLAFLSLLAMFIIQQFESIILSPMIVGSETKIHPSAVLFAILVGGYLFGALGIIISVPVTAVIKVWVEKNYINIREE